MGFLLVAKRFLIILLFVLPLWFLIRKNYRKKHVPELNVYYEWFVHLFFFYLLAVFYLTMQPFDFQIPFYGERIFYFDYNLFYQLRHMASSHLYYQMLYSLGNILLFIPFGMLTPVLFKKCRKVRFVLLFGFLFSLMIELTQGLFTLTRKATLDDIFFNTSGALIGYLIFLIIKIVQEKQSNV